MLDDDMPNFPETSPQDYYPQEMEENQPEQVQEFQEIQEVPVQQSQIENQNQSPFSYQAQPQLQSPSYTEDILLQSAGVFDSNKTYSTQMIQDELELGPEILPPIYQSAQVPLTTNNEEQNMNLNEYNNINNINAFKSYSNPAQQNNINNNQQFATVSPINNDFNNNGSYVNNNDNNEYVTEINPQYTNDNIIYSTPIQIKPNVINQNNITSSFPQSQPLISPINYINSNNSNFGSELENEIEVKNITKVNKGMKNLNLSDKKNEVTIKLTGKKNNNNVKSNFNINNDLNRTNFFKSGNQKNNTKNLNNFSRDGWTLFYSENDPFFTNINNIKDVIPNQRIENPEENEVYIGEINRAGQKHGYGKLITPEYEKEGTWKNNRFNGWGREVRKNGEIYEGRFVNDTLNGKGKYKKGNILYIGDFVNYDQHGKGELFTDEYHYTGDFKRNGFHGYGRIELYDIGVYEGEFKDKEITGYGIFKYTNGDFYEGEMNQGKKEGNGKFIAYNGKTLEGEFNNDEFVGKENSRTKKSFYKKSYKY